MKDGDAKILNVDDLGNGIYVYEYAVPKIQPNGINAGKPVTVDGVVQYKSKSETKTVYDPLVHADSKMASMALKAAVLGFPQAKANYLEDNVNRVFTSTYGGIKFTFYLKTNASGEVVVTNSHPSR